MTRYFVLYFCVLLLMPVVDTALILARRRKDHPRRVYDRRSLFVLWLLLVAGFAAAVGLRTIGTGRITLDRPMPAAIAVVLMLLGMIVRWAAMIRLGGFFNPHVEIAEGQRLITAGLYRYVRHPAYAGIILVFIGIGFAFENWLSLAAVVSMAALGVANRVRIEEAALREHFGPAYEEYARRTKRFVPYVI